MANANRGEVTIKIGEKDYILRYSANSLCDLEDVVGLPVLQITDMLSDTKKLSMKLVRALLWAGLKEKQPEITLLQAGELVGELSLAGAYEQIGNAFQKAFPTPKKVEVENPPKLDASKQGGTGPASMPDGSN